MALYKKLATAIICSMLISNSYAEYSNAFFPRGCEVRGFGYSTDYLIINENGFQTFYLIQNKSNKTIELENYETNPDVFMSPKLECKISPNRWSAFASDVKNTHFNCFINENGKRLATKCSNVLEVCQYPRVRFAVSNMGSYWVSTNKPQSQVVQESINKGIFLRW
jgi:hypothetical protein